jgi:hypothetical protein
MNEGIINTSHYLNGLSFHNVEVKDGSIGVNLQSRYIGIGAYVDSFYRNKDNSLLPAEECGTICLGDIIFSINSTSLITLNLKEIYEVIRHSKYPLKLIFLRLSEYKYNLIELIIDPRKVSFIDNFLNNNIKGKSIIANQIVLLNQINIILNNLTNPKIIYQDDDIMNLILSIWCSEYLNNILDNCKDDLKYKIKSLKYYENNNNYSNINDLIQEIMELKKLLWNELLLSFVNSFNSSSVSKRLIGFLFESKKFFQIPIFDLLNNSFASFFLFIFLIKRIDLALLRSSFTISSCSSSFRAKLAK